MLLSAITKNLGPLRSKMLLLVDWQPKSDSLAMASELLANASNLVAMASNLIEMASNLILLLVDCRLVAVKQNITTDHCC